MMNDDIRFYDFDFNLLYILPPYSKDGGYTAVNASMQLAGSGSIEITFRDDELKQKVQANRDKIIVVWRDFQGYITGCMFMETTYKLFGKHLNGLLNRTVISTINSITTLSGYMLKNFIIPNIEWLTAESDLDSKGVSITYSTDKYMTADKIVQEICELSKSGYIISADIPNKRFVYHYVDRANNSLMLSVPNLNIYDPEITYENTDLAFGGWYEEEAEDGSTWKYITNGSGKTGIYKIDTVLSATTAAEAQKELAKCVSEYDIAVKTKNVFHGIDYSIGDIIRVQTNGITEKRLVSGINMWNEQTYGEEPILTEI